MASRSSLSRILLITATAAGFAASAGTAAAASGDNATAVDTHRPAGAGEGRKIG